MLSFVHSALILIVQCFVSACIALRWLLASVLVLCGMCGQMEDRLRWSGNWVRLHWYPVSIQSCQLYSFFFYGKKQNKTQQTHTHTHMHTHTHIYTQTKQKCLSLEFVEDPKQRSTSSIDRRNKKNHSRFSVDLWSGKKVYKSLKYSFECCRFD